MKINPEHPFVIETLNRATWVPYGSYSNREEAIDILNFFLDCGVKVRFTTVVRYE
jgi:hypothetical protein